MKQWGHSMEDKLKCLEKIQLTHYIVHAHGNNNDQSSSQIPNVLELTYVNKDYFKIPPDLNTTPFPTKLDFPNKKSVPQLIMNKYPFVAPTPKKLKKKKDKKDKKNKKDKK